jgi:hypothetical protein
MRATKRQARPSPLTSGKRFSRNPLVETGRMQRGQVATASGMVSVQADCTPDHALTLMVERAAKCGTKVEEIADAVVDRRIRFDLPADA